MPDIASITAIISSLKTATDLAKIVKDSGISLEKAEVKLKLADLISALADAKIEIANIQSLLFEKEQTIAKLLEKQDVRNSIRYDAPYYWLDSPDGRNGPFCQCCYDKNEKLIRLIERHTIKGTYTCHVCNSWYGPGHFSM